MLSVFLDLRSPPQYCALLCLHLLRLEQRLLGLINLRLRLHYPLIVSPTGPELAGAEQSYGNAWAKGVFLIDDAQLHAVRNTGESKRSIVLCDILRKDLPRISPETLSKFS